MKCINKIAFLLLLLVIDQAGAQAINANGSKDRVLHFEDNAIKDLMRNISSNLGVRQDEGVHNVIRGKILHAMKMIAKESDYDEKIFNQSIEQQEAVQGFFVKYGGKLICTNTRGQGTVTFRTPCHLLKRVAEFYDRSMFFGLIMNRGKILPLNDIEVYKDENGKEVKETLLDYLGELQSKLENDQRRDRTNTIKIVRGMMALVKKQGGKRASELKK